MGRGALGQLRCQRSEFSRGIARRYFMKHWCKKEEILLADERDFEIGVAAFFELERGAGRELGDPVPAPVESRRADLGRGKASSKTPRLLLSSRKRSSRYRRGR
jgi:hypothetical protein